MENDFNELQKILSENGLPDSVGLLSKDCQNSEIKELVKKVCESSIAAIGKDNSLLPFLPDCMGAAVPLDLGAVGKLLAGYPCVTGAFFKESTVIAEAGGPRANEFRTASGRDRSKFADDRKSPKLSGDKEKKPSESNVDEYILERIRGEILESNVNLSWDDIVGLGDVKRTINEIILWPMMRPDIFTGLRAPPKGLLLFGPPGTGKTMICKCIASQCKATFFSISASSLTSKWVGEGEKMVRGLFHLAREMSPSVIFIDEIDSLLSQRTDNENEGSRRIKTEFLVQFDGAAVGESDRILVVGATNRPHEIDEAARRRLVKRIYVPLPETANRKEMVRKLIAGYSNDITEDGLCQIASMTEDYSGSDMFNLCREATLEPLREIKNINTFTAEETRPICLDDFVKAKRQIRQSVSKGDLDSYLEWNEKFGSMPS